MPEKMFVATLIDDETHVSQVASTRESAIYWLTTQIPASDWEAFYDSLPETERGPMTRDRAAMTSEQILDSYAGRNEDGTWGVDVYLMEVVEQNVWTLTGAAPTP